MSVGGFRRPSKTVSWLMGGLLFIWIVFATAINWADGAGRSVFELLIGDSSKVLRGQIWRLVTASLVHQPTGPGAVGHILFTLLLIFFFLPALEERWGPRRLLSFLAGSAAFAYAVETLVHALLPTVAHRLWFGGGVFVDAAVVAWALGNKDSVIRLYFVIPMKPMVMVWLMLALNVLELIARSSKPEGVFAPFAAMGAGFLFGSDQSPVRRAYLKWKLKRLQSEVDGLTKKPPRKRRAPHLKVIEGGAKDDDGPVLH